MSEEGSTYQPVVLMAVVLFLALLPSFSFPAVLPLVEQDWGLRPSQSGTVMAFFQVGYILTAIIALPLTDRLDARRIILCGALLTVVSHILFPLVAKDLISACVLRGLAGAGIGCIYMPGLRVVSTIFAAGLLGSTFHRICLEPLSPSSPPASSYPFTLGSSPI